MVCFDIRHDGDGRRKSEKGAIVLVGFDYVQSVASSQKVPAPRRNPTADKRCWILPSRCKRGRCHDRRRRFPMRSGDADQISAAGDRRHFSEGFSATNHGNPERSRAREFGMILRHRRCHDECARAVDMRRIVSLDDDAESREIGRGVGIRIATSDTYSSSHEQLGERAHPRAGNTDEMNGARIGRIEKRHSRIIASARRRIGDGENMACDLRGRVWSSTRSGAARKTRKLDWVAEDSTYGCVDTVDRELRLRNMNRGARFLKRHGVGRFDDRPRLSAAGRAPVEFPTANNSAVVIAPARAKARGPLDAYAFAIGAR